MGKITVCRGVRVIHDYETERCEYCKDYYPASDFEAITRQLAEAREQLEVCQRLSDTFWDALKPLGLKEIYLSCPGQHVVDLIRERDKAREEIARLRKPLEFIAGQ